MSAQIASIAAGYYAVGAVWLLTGLVPSGWLTHNMPPFIAALYVLIGAAIWPLILGKIVWRMVIHGDEEIEL